jgi:hypothetical protein
MVMKKIAIAVAWGIMLMLSSGVAGAQEKNDAGSGIEPDLTGLFPSFNRGVANQACDWECPDIWEVKCLQPARYVEAYVGDDRGCGSVCADTTELASMVGVLPTAIYGHGVARLIPAGNTELLFLTKTGPEAALKALVTVSAAAATSGGFQDYFIEAFCYSVVNGAYRNTRLLLKQDG